MLKLVKLWILGSAACVAAGWILSAGHQLNAAGYTVALVICIAGLIVQGRRWHREDVALGRGKLTVLRWRRFRRPMPMLFLLITVAATVGGALYPPNNYDGLTYRFPRVLDWWAAGSWCWVNGPVLRANVSGTGFEWLMMPMFILTHSDRLFFLFNIAAFVFLPTLVFLVFRAGGAARRVAWFWMWLLPAALCYAMQAGSISNDTIAATYFLAAIYFALNARLSGKAGDVWLSLLAIGLLTGVKASNLPLLLPLVWALWPVRRLLPKRPFGSVVVLLVTVLISFVPTAALNQYYAGNWGGDPSNIEKVQLRNPVAGIVGNGLQLILQSLEPPFLPLAHTAEVWVWNEFPEGVREYLNRNFPRFGVGFRELPQEESAGVGIGILAAAVVSIYAWNYSRGEKWSRANPARRRGIAIGTLTWAALFVFMTKLGSESTSRLVAAYYPLMLLPLLLNRGQDNLVRDRLYNALGVLSGIVALGAVILTPSRPLWPAQSFFAWGEETFPQSAFMQHAARVFTVYHDRNDLFAAVRQSIPESVETIGLIEENDDAEASLWRPYGHRRVVHLWKDGRCQDRNVQWVVVKNSMIGGGTAEGFKQWLDRNGGTLVSQQPITEKVSHGSEIWSVVRLPASKS